MMGKGLPKSWVPRCEVVQFMNFKVVLRRRSQKTCFSIIDFLHLLPHRMYIHSPISNTNNYYCDGFSTTNSTLPLLCTFLRLWVNMVKKYFNVYKPQS